MEKMKELYEKVAADSALQAKLKEIICAIYSAVMDGDTDTSCGNHLKYD